jgi:histone-lysine N-methyltransferase SUV39H
MTEFQNMLDVIPGAIIRVSNSINLEPPPSDFVYITSFLYGHNVPKPDPAFLTGCECQDGFCNSKNCFCVNQNTEHGNKHTGNYTADGRLKSIVLGRNLQKTQPFIYECNERCSCNESNACLNRVIQGGRKVPLEIFFLGDARGWGVRAIEMIPAGTFVDLYHGEIITDEEADERYKTVYKGDWRSLYLFDLDFSADAGTKADYTVDAYRYGSVSRFFNHNCNPNLLIAPCFIDHIDQSLHFIAFFAARDIHPDEELCFDYTNERGRITSLETKKHESVKYDSGIIRCLCGARNCRQYIYPLANKS